MFSRVTITYNGYKTWAHYTSISPLIRPIKPLLFQRVYDNSLTSHRILWGYILSDKIKSKLENKLMKVAKG